MLITIAVVGDKASGKTSLIQSLVGNDENQILTITVSEQDVQLQFIESEQIEKLDSVDIILLVTERNSNAYKRVNDVWIPSILKSKKLFYIVETKGDEKFDKIESLKRHKKFIGSSVFLPESEDSKASLVNALCLAYFEYPLYSVFDEKKQVLRGIAEKALKRIFWIADADKDGVLNEKEWNALQKQCFDVLYENDEFAKLVGLEKDKLKSGISVEEFLIFMRELIKHHQQVDLWNVLRKFGYNDNVRLDFFDLFSHIDELKVEDTTTLSQTGMQLLTKLFKYFDKDKDGLLSKSEVEEAFSIVSDGNAFSKISQDYLSMAETKNDKLTLNGWISLWCLVTLLNPFELFKCLICWGYKENLRSMVEIKKKREYRKSPSDMPNTILCYVFGPPKSGKSSLLDGLVNRRISSEYKPTKAQRYAVNKVDVDEGQSYYLVMTEFAYSEYQKVLASEELMRKCDIALLAYDGNDRYSFRPITLVQKSLYPFNIPCVYVLTKYDLPVVDQELEVTPQEFCEQLELPWPPIRSSMKDDFENRDELFQTLVLCALDPESAIPVLNDDEDDEESGRKFVKQTITMVGIAGVIALIGAVLWKCVLKKRVKG